MELFCIARKWLKDNGYDGLCLPEEECGCSLEDFMPCGEPSLKCEAGCYAKAPPGSDVDYFIYPGKGKQNGR